MSAMHIRKFKPRQRANLLIHPLGEFADKLTTTREGCVDYLPWLDLASIISWGFGFLNRPPSWPKPTLPTSPLCFLAGGKGLVVS